MGQFVNDVSTCVTEALEGVAFSSFGNLVLVRDKNVKNGNQHPGGKRQFTMESQG